MRSSFRYLITAFILTFIITFYFNRADISKTWADLDFYFDSSAGMNEVVENGIKSITVTGGNAELYTTIVLQPPSLPTDESTTPPSPPTDESTIPPAPTPLSKIIVIAKLEREDTSWVGENLPDWQNAIYTVDNINASLHTSVNKGREANAYLTYLVNSYDELPDIIAFIHSHRKGYPGGWHTDAMDYDNVISLQTLNINFVQRQGYTNLRCIAVPGCPDEVQPFRNPPEAYRKHEHAFPAAWKYMFVDKDIPSVVGTPCCSQFAVSKEQVLARPRSDYMRYLQWLSDTNLSDAISGRIFEYLWHIIFGQGPV